MKKYTRTETFDFIEEHADGSVTLQIEGTLQKVVVPADTFKEYFKEVKVAKRSGK